MSVTAVTEPLSVHVALDGGRDYPILIGRGLVAQAGARIAALGARAAGIVTDANVAALYGDALKASLEEAGLRAGLIVVPPGEASKSYARFAEVCDGLLALKIERNDVVVALGAAWSAISPVSRRRACGGACASSRCRRASSRRSIPPWAGRPASTRPTART